MNAFSKQFTSTKLLFTPYWILLVVAASFGTDCTFPPENPVIHILPEGDVSLETCKEVGQEIQRVFSCKFFLLSPEKFPPSIWYEPGKRNRADKILEWLNESKKESGIKTLAITQGDISTTKGTVYDWGIFGLAYQPGCCGVVSMFRLKHSSRSAQHLKERTIKIALHETGHMFGLPHCKNKQCVMTDAQGKVNTVDNCRSELCNDCKNY